MIQEFEDCLDRNDFVADSISKHHEDNDSFNQRFTSDINKLVNSIPVNPFNKTSITKLSTPKVIVPEAVRNVIENLKQSGKEQLMSFIDDRLILGQVPISHPITTNKIDIWDCTEKAQTIEFSPSASDLKKMNSAYENRKQLTE